jgi:ribulose-phosphate 3-epimerase
MGIGRMRLSASLYAADPLRLGEAVSAVTPYVGSLHVDVMDGRFAPAFGFGEQLVSRLVAGGAPPIDVHLMVDEPESAAVRFARLGVRSVAFHVEATPDAAALAKAIRAAGARAYAALLPETEPATVIPIASDIDGILLLTAPPGVGTFSDAAFERIARTPAGLPMIVDGRLQPVHFGALRAQKVELAVVGAALFDGGAPAERARQFDRLASGEATAIAD